MLNEVDFEIENEDSESKSKVQLLKTYSIVTSSPSVSTIVSLSDGGVSRINKYSIASNETRQFKDFMYEDKASKDPTNTFVYKKSISVLNTTHNKGYCIQKKMTFDSSDKPFKSNTEDTPNSSNDFGVFCRYEEQLSSLLNSIRLTSVSVDDCIGLWDIVINKDITNTIERYLNVNNKKPTLFYLRYLELLSIMLSCVYGKCISDTIKKRLIELMRGHYRIMMSILKLIIEQNATLPNHMLNQLKKLINRRDLNYKTSTSTSSSTSTSTTLNHQSQSNHLDNGDEYYSSLILSYINTIASIHQEIILYQPEELKAIDKDVICRINDIMQNEALFSMNDIDRIFKSEIIPAVSFNHDRNSTSTNYANANANANQGNNHRKLLEKIDLKTPKLYLNKESLKEYTLVLALQNTLINYIKENDDDDEGVIKFRPGLHEFLSNCCLYYELVVFTCLPKEEADPIIDEIEQNNIYFDYRLYKQHMQLINNTCVKDLNNLGRDLSRIIIIDHLPQSFALQKENGIFIKAFRGEDADDCALLDLNPILKNIAIKEMDVREGIEKFKSDIATKISSNYYRSHSH